MRIASDMAKGLAALVLFSASMDAKGFYYTGKVDGIRYGEIYSGWDAVNQTQLYEAAVIGIDQSVTNANILEIAPLSDGYSSDNYPRLPVRGIYSGLEGRTNLTSLYMPDSITWTHSSPSGCTKLETVRLSNNLKELRYEFFSGCTSLQVVNIPDSVTSLSGTFSGCTSLRTVNIPAGVTNLTRTFEGCTSLRTVTIPNGVTNLTSTFSGCTNLTSVTLPAGCIELANTFYGCSSLKGVTIPGNVTTVGDHTFYGCSTLDSVTIPSQVSSLGASAFYGCTNLRTVMIFGNITNIYYRTNPDSSWMPPPFQGCPNLSLAILGGILNGFLQICSGTPVWLILKSKMVWKTSVRVLSLTVQN